MWFWRGGVLASCNTPCDHIYPPVMSVASLVSTCGSGEVVFWHLVILHEIIFFPAVMSVASLVSTCGSGEVVFWHLVILHEIIFTRQLCLLLLLFQHVVLERWCSGTL